MTPLLQQANRVRSKAAVCLAALAGLGCAWSAAGQTLLGDDPIVASPKRLADDRIEVRQVPLPVQDKGEAILRAEMKAAVELLQKQVDQEKKKRLAAEARVRELSASLAEANRVREEQTKAHNELRLKMQAFGVDLLKGDPQGIEQRLLKAVRDLDLARQDNEKLGAQMTALSEALLHYTQLAPGADERSRAMAENALRGANEVLGKTAGPHLEPGRKLTEGKVVSIDAEAGLIVIDVGRDSGARIGMPLEVLRDDRSIGTALVVDVRDRICGAVLQEMASGKDDVKIGDRIRPKPENGTENI